MKGKYLFVAAYLAKIFGARTNFYAIGATSFPDILVKLLSKIALSNADEVSVRDPLSISNLRKLGIKRELVLVRDPALSLEPARPEEAVRILESMGLRSKASRSRPLVGINFRYVNDPAVNNERSLTQAAQLVRYFIREKKCDVLFLPISHHPSKHLEDDLDFGRQVRNRLDHVSHYFILEDYLHPRLMMALMGEMDCMILSRLHSVILGSKMNAPIFTVSYDDKVTQFVRLIQKEDMLMKLNDFSAEKAQQCIGTELDLIIESKKATTPQ